MKNKVLKIFNKKIILEDSSDKELLKGVTTDVIGDVSSFIGDSSKFLSQLAKFTIKSGWLTFRAKILKNMSDEDFKRALKDTRVSFVDSSDRTISSIDNTTKSMLSKAGISDSELSAFALTVPGVTIFDKINLSDLLTGRLYNKNLYTKYKNIDHNMYQLIIFWMLYEKELHIPNEDGEKNKVISPTKAFIDQKLRENVQKFNKIKPKLNLFLNKKVHPEFFDIMNNEVLKKKDKETFNLVKKALENRTYTSSNIIKNKTSKKFLEKLSSYLKSIKKSSLINTKKNESAYKLKKVLQINNKNIILKENIGNDFEIDEFAPLILELSKSIAVAVILENKEIEDIVTGGEFDLKAEFLKQVNKKEKTNKKFNDLGDKIENSSESEQKDLNNKTFEIEKSDSDISSLDQYYDDYSRIIVDILINFFIMKAILEYNKKYGPDPQRSQNFNNINKLGSSNFNDLFYDEVKKQLDLFNNISLSTEIKNIINDYNNLNAFIFDKDNGTLDALNKFFDFINDFRNKNNKNKYLTNEIKNIQKELIDRVDNYYKFYNELLIKNLRIKNNNKKSFSSDIKNLFSDFKDYENDYEKFEKNIKNLKEFFEIEKIINESIDKSCFSLEKHYESLYIGIFIKINEEIGFDYINALSDQEIYKEINIYPTLINDVNSYDDINEDIANCIVQLINLHNSEFKESDINDLDKLILNLVNKFKKTDSELTKMYDELIKIDGKKFLFDNKLSGIIDLDNNEFKNSEYGKKLEEIYNSSFSEIKNMLINFNNYVFDNNNYIKKLDSNTKVKFKNSINDEIKNMKL